MSKEHISIENKADCCGCTACYSACPKKAITMKDDEEGFLYPVVDTGKCIDCGICVEVCPIKRRQPSIESQDYYAVKNGNDDLRMKSTSGGVFSLLAQYVIEHKGVVYGAAFNENFDVVHQRAEDNTWVRFRGSKYVQSNMNNMFEEIVKDLKNDMLVLFTGTPCQIDGIRTYLDRLNVNMDKFITCDLVCHGVPSPLVWKDYLQECVINRKDLKKINFREKNNAGWHNSRLQAVNFQDEKVIDLAQGEGVFLSLFSNNIILRPSCYTCRYTNFDRVGDFTLGDFWGIEKHYPSFDDDKGITLLMLNSTKARDIWEKIKDKTTYISVKKEECIQPNLFSPSQCYGNRKLFWTAYKKRNLVYAAKVLGIEHVSGREKILYKISRVVFSVLIKLEIY